MGTNVLVAPQLLDWAIERSGKSFPDLVRAVPQLPKWIQGTAEPTYPQLEKFARSTFVPLGSLFLDEPPVEELLITDFRIVDGGTPSDPSPNLIDTIDICLARQGWYRDYRQSIEADPVPQVGSLNTRVLPSEAARLMLEGMGLGSYAELSYTRLDEVFSALSERIERMGVMVMVNGVVGSNTRRKLDYREFRGFALADPFAPLIFVNGTDTRTPKIFTLIHELAHIYLGDRGISAVEPRARNANSHEQWCNAVAAEFLVPETAFRESFVKVKIDAKNLSSELDRLAHIFKVSTLVILLRLKDLGITHFSDFNSVYEREKKRVSNRQEQTASNASGGNFYNTQGVRTGKRFARAVISDTIGGQTLHRDAFRLLGIKTYSTFETFAQKLGVT